MSAAGFAARHWASCNRSEPLYNVAVVSLEEYIVPDANLAATEDGRDFGAAVARFQRFLKQNNYSEDLLWLTPDDVLLSGKRFMYVRFPVPITHELKARSAYEKGMALGRGLLMSTLCELGSSTCCYLWYPKQQEDVPQGIRPHDGSVKMSAKMEAARTPGKPVKSSVVWALLKHRHRKHQDLKDFLFS